MNYKAFFFLLLSEFHQNFIWIVLGLLITVGNLGILVIVSLPVQEHRTLCSKVCVSFNFINTL